jgi:tryptophan synthase beta chain
MGRRDINRQRPNVFRMRLNDAEVTPVDVGRGTLKEAISETMRDWAGTVETTHYVIGSVVGPAPFPAMVRDFQSVISEEARRQSRETFGELPGAVVACAGGGSNTMGTFAEFTNSAGQRPADRSSGGPASEASGTSSDPWSDGERSDPRDDEDVDLYAVEAGGSALDVDEAAGVAPNSASLSIGEEGVLHGARTKLLQDGHGQILESHSVSSGLDYSGVGPELAHLVDEGRVTPVNVDDDAALEAFHRLSSAEGVIPALETAHAFGFLEAALGPEATLDVELPETILVNVSGRGDKDLEAVIEETERRDIDDAPSMEVFE